MYFFVKILYYTSVWLIHVLISFLNENKQSRRTTTETGLPQSIRKVIFLSLTERKAMVKTRSKSKGKGSVTPSRGGKSSGGRTHANVLFFVPNLIGYLRIVMTGVFFYYAFDSSTYELAIGAYITSFALDFFDGYFARLLDQCSKLGQVLDMVTDRVSTAVLLVVLTHIDPDKSHAWIYTSMLALDFTSHWFHMRSSAGHHKKVEEDRNIILRIYYAYYYFFGYCCVSAEFTWIFLYIKFNNAQAFASLPYGDVLSVNFLLKYCLMPGCIVKNIVNVAQLYDAMVAIAKVDAAEYNEAQKSKK